jgi:long-subunit fatty acid transport protein
MHSQTGRSAGWFLFAFSCFIILLNARASPCLAQDGGIDFTSSPNPLGSGARALGMGGAFIAVADDATAASWNPGGLVQLERPEISAVGEAVRLTEDNQFKERPEGSGKQSSKSASLNYLSAAYPFTLLDHNMVVSMNYQHLYDFSRKWQVGMLSDNPYMKTDWGYQADGGLYAYGLAYSVQLIPQLSFGFTLNFWQDGIYQNGWQTLTRWHVLIDMGKNRRFTEDYLRNDRYSFNGFNANLGFLWNITEQLNLGVVFKSPFTAGIRHDFDAVTVDNYSNRKKQPVPYLENGTDFFDLGMPMSYGFGLAYRFSDRLTLSADVYRTEWGRFLISTPDGKEFSALSGLPKDQSDVSATTQAHVGAEYLIIKPKYTIPLRAGFFYDPGPAEKSPDNYYGFSAGTGIGIGRFVFDLAYVYRFGNDVKKTLVEGVTFSQNVAEHAVYTSLIIHF